MAEPVGREGPEGARRAAGQQACTKAERAQATAGSTPGAFGPRGRPARRLGLANWRHAPVEERNPSEAWRRTNNTTSPGLHPGRPVTHSLGCISRPTYFIIVLIRLGMDDQRVALVDQGPLGHETSPATSKISCHVAPSLVKTHSFHHFNYCNEPTTPRLHRRSSWVYGI